MNNNFSCNNDDTTQSRRNVRNTSTQTKARPCKCNDKKQVKSTATQTFLTKDNIVVQQKKLPLRVSCLLAHRQKMLLPIWTISINCLHTKILITRFQTRQSPSSTVPTNLTATMLDLIVTILIAIPKTAMLRNQILNQNSKLIVTIVTKMLF